MFTSAASNISRDIKTKKVTSNAKNNHLKHEYQKVNNPYHRPQEIVPTDKAMVSFETESSYITPTK